MPGWLVKVLGFLYERTPVAIRPFAKRVFLASLMRAEGISTARRVFSGRRVEFLDFEIAHLEPYEFLGPGKREVRIESQYSLVSPGTERAVLCGLPGARRRFPYTPGYSTAGVARQVGSAVADIRVGDRVTGKLNHLSHGVAPAGSLFKIPDGVSSVEASFIELGIITLQGIRKARIKPGDRVAVVGQGLIGQLANRLARVVGASMVIAIAPSKNRQRVAMQPGGADRYLALRGNEGSVRDVQADIVIEAVGSPQAITTALECARDGGTVVLLGSSRGLSRDLNLLSLAQERGVTTIGAHISAMPDLDASSARWTYRQEGELFLDLLRADRLSVADLVTWYAKPDECNVVYETLAEGGRDQVGIVFDWNGSGVTSGVAMAMSRGR